MDERFNAAGRNCPVCYRADSLAGDLSPGLTVECSGGRGGGCYARFRVDGVAPRTLTSVREYRPIENVCPSCGRKHFGRFAECVTCAGVGAGRAA